MRLKASSADGGLASDLVIGGCGGYPTKLTGLARRLTQILVPVIFGLLSTTSGAQTQEVGQGRIWLAPKADAAAMPTNKPVIGSGCTHLANSAAV